MPLMKFELQPVRLADGPDVGHPPEQLPEHHGDLAAGQVGAEAEVRARAAEAEVVVRRAADVEAERVVEDGLVAVGRGVPEHDLVALVERRGRRCAAPSWVTVRRKWITGVAQRTISSTAVGASAVEVGQPAGLLLGVLGEGCRPWEMALRVVSLPATTSRMKNDASSGGRERLAVDLGGHQRGGEVVLRVLDPRLGQLGDELAEVLRRGRGARPSRRRSVWSGDVLGVAERRGSRWCGRR